MNVHYKNRYNKFIDAINKLGKRTFTEYTETHHIVPKCLHGSDNQNNLIELSLREHFLAHWLLWKAYPNCLPIVSAFLQMNHKNPKTVKPFQGRITSRIYATLRAQAYKLISDSRRNKVYVRDPDGKLIELTKTAYAESDYKFHTTGKINVLDTTLDKWVYISVSEYRENKTRYRSRLSSDLNGGRYSCKFLFIDQETKEIVRITKAEARAENEKYGYKRLRHLQKKTVKCVSESGDVYRVKLEVYDPKVDTPYNAGLFSVLDTTDGKYKSISLVKYNQDRSRYITNTKGKVIAKNKHGTRVVVSKAEFNSGEFVGQTAGLTTVYDKKLGQYRQVTSEEFKTNKSNYAGPCSGKLNVINKITGERKQIPKDQYDPEIHLPLGNKKYLFLCRNKLTGKEKNINIYEWVLVQNNYEIVDLNKFNQIKHIIGEL